MRPPYHFVPVPDARASRITAAPIYHHGANAEQNDLVSGELLCELTALTPLIAGNDQYSVADARGCTPDGDVVSLPDAWNLGATADARKKIVEPLRHSGVVGAPVLIAPESLKGMFRQTLAALLGAPMERVREQTYSYRPNLSVPRPDERPERMPIAAAVHSVDYDRLHLHVHPIKRLGAVTFARNQAVARLIAPSIVPANPGCPYPTIPVGTAITDIARVENQGRGRLQQAAGGTWNSGASGQVRLRYRQGIDGECALARLHADANHTAPPVRHPEVYVAVNELDLAAPVDVAPEVVKQYKATIDHLRDNNDGHASSRHPLPLGPSGINPPRVEAGDLIYAEAEVEWHGNSFVIRRIVSFGHHFRYRWRYVDTVRTRLLQSNNSAGGVGFKWSTRPEVAPLPGETAKDEKGRAATLSAARLFFGYVSDPGAEAAIGEGNFQRLAGRIAFNTAVERVGTADDAQRFLSPANGHVIALKPLGTPRASAVEFYLNRQAAGTLAKAQQATVATYGDFAYIDTSAVPPRIRTKNRAPALNGRKFYLHQPEAAMRASLYALDDANDPGCNHRRGSQAVLARFVSNVGSCFRFACRFRDLRLWEIGAAVAALAPQAYAAYLLQARPNDFTDTLAFLARPGASKRFALKLGHARPLGLGSVEIRVPGLRDEHGRDLEVRAEQYFGALTERLRGNDALLRQWFAVLWFDHDYGVVAYPHGEEATAAGGDIFDFHTAVRRAHRGARRFDKADPHSGRLPDLA